MVQERKSVLLRSKYEKKNDPAWTGDRSTQGRYILFQCGSFRLFKFVLLGAEENNQFCPSTLTCPETKSLVLPGTKFLILRQPSKFRRSEHIPPHFIIVLRKKQGGIFQTFFKKMDGDDGIGQRIGAGPYFFPHISLHKHQKNLSEVFSKFPSRFLTFD